MDTRPVLKFKNVYPQAPPKPIYTNVKIDVLSKTRLKANRESIMFPSGHSIIALPLDKDSPKSKISLNHTGMINLFNASHHDHVVASTCRHDSSIRIWDVFPKEDPQILESPKVILNGHNGKIESITFHPIFSDILASTSTDGTLKLWSLNSFKDKLSLQTNDDSFLQSICFDYFGNSIISISSCSTLQLYDPRSSNYPIQKVQTLSSKIKPAKVVWLHPDPLLVSTGFDKNSNRTVFLWDTRRLDKPLSETSFGSSFAQLEPVWDSELPVLYLPARNESLNIMELKNGNLYRTNNATLDKTSSCLEILPKSLCNTSKCEIAKFLRLGSDQSIDTLSIHVPRVNSDTVFQQDLYPVYTLSSIKDSSFWFDTSKANQLDSVLEPDNPRVPSAAAEFTVHDAIKPLHAQDEIQDSLHFDAFMETKTWWLTRNWEKVSVILRNKIYISVKEKNLVLVDCPSNLASFHFDDNSNTASLKWPTSEILLKFENLTHIDMLIDALSRFSTKIFSGTTCTYQPVLVDRFRILDTLQRTQAFGNWPIRYAILEKDAIISIYNDKNLDESEKILDLEKLLGIFPVSITSHQCPSGRFSVLPIFMFRLVFASYHYLFCAKTEKQRDNWIVSIVYWTRKYDFHPPRYLVTDSNQLFNIELLQITPQSNTDIEIGEHYMMLILYDSIQVVNGSYDSTSICLTISRSDITNLKPVGDYIFMLIFGQYKSITFRLDFQQNQDLMQESFQEFMMQNIPSSIGIKSDEDLEELTKLSIDSNTLSFYIDDKVFDSSSMFMIVFGNSGELQACKPNYNSVFRDYACLLETKSEIFHWKGPNCKKRIHAKALDVAVKIRRYRNLRPKLTLIENDEPKDMLKLYSLIGYFDPDKVKDGPNIIQGDSKLFQIDSKAKYVSSKLILVKKSRRLSKNLLKPNLVFIVTLQNMIFLWNGSVSNHSDKALGRTFSRHLAHIVKEKSPAICECMENQEHPLFWEAFDDVCGPLPILMCPNEPRGNIAPVVDQKEIDYKIFEYPTVYEEEGQNFRMVKVSIFRIVNFRLRPVETLPVLLKTSESYLVLYLYQKPLSGLTRAINFFWQGSQSPVIDKGTAAMLTIELSEGFDGECSQIRQVQGKESIQFCRILGGVNIVDSELSFPVAFDIRAKGPNLPCKSYQIADFEQIPWHINHVMLFLSAHEAYVWGGQFALESEIFYAKELATRFGIYAVQVNQDFQDMNLAKLGIIHFNDPMHHSLSKCTTRRFNERFFQTVSITGSVEIQPLKDMTQSDLEESKGEIFILDNLETIYVWVSESCKPCQISLVITDLRKMCTNNRLHDKTKLFITFKGHEPFEFRSSIHGWKNTGINTDKVISAEEYLQLSRST